MARKVRVSGDTRSSGEIQIYWKNNKETIKGK